MWPEANLGAMNVLCIMYMNYVKTLISWRRVEIIVALTILSVGQKPKIAITHFHTNKKSSSRLPSIMSWAFSKQRFTCLYYDFSCWWNISTNILILSLKRKIYIFFWENSYFIYKLLGISKIEDYLVKSHVFYNIFLRS